MSISIFWVIFVKPKKCASLSSRGRIKVVSDLPYQSSEKEEAPSGHVTDFPYDLRLFWKLIYRRFQNTKALSPSLYIDGGTSFWKFWVLRSIFNFFFKWSKMTWKCFSFTFFIDFPIFSSFSSFFRLKSIHKETTLIVYLEVFSGYT